ncbi:unnamed protein product [Schistocephalus solidus]|uniref:IMD domain-containing protein n=1 Tax=Schistocephalus solidus TaxID=70667 RepID=A0A183SZ76_SCHSO|nr:unnamed protein product [Schistocephalus solidus]
MLHYGPYITFCTTIQCLAGFLEAFQKISDIAQSSNFGLRDLGMTMTRFCLRQRGVESRLRTFNSQLGDCLIAPLTDRLEEWKRTVNQLDRDTVKELRKARGELQRATAEAEKCKKRLRRKDSSTTMLAFAHEEPSSVDTSCYLPSGASSSVQANFVQQDLLCKQRALESLERNCLKRAVVEERRRFTELTTCLEPVLLDLQRGANAKLPEHEFDFSHTSIAARADNKIKAARRYGDIHLLALVVGFLLFDSNLGFAFLFLDFFMFLNLDPPSLTCFRATGKKMQPPRT